MSILEPYTIHKINFDKWCPKCLHSTDDTYAIPDRCDICKVRKEGFLDDRPIFFRDKDELIV